MNTGELMQRLGCHFTDEEKEKCIPLVEKLYNYAYMVREEGFFSLEKAIDNETNTFLKLGLAILINGNTDNGIAYDLHNMIEADGYTGVPLLERLLIAKAIEQLNGGVNFKYFRLGLLSMLGEKYAVSWFDY